MSESSEYDVYWAKESTMGKVPKWFLYAVGAIIVLSLVGGYFFF